MTNAKSTSSDEKSAHVYFSAGDVPDDLRDQIKKAIQKAVSGPQGQTLLDIDPNALEIRQADLEMVRHLVQGIINKKARGKYTAEGVGNLLVTKKYETPKAKQSQAALPLKKAKPIQTPTPEPEEEPQRRGGGSWHDAYYDN